MTAATMQQIVRTRISLQRNWANNECGKKNTEKVFQLFSPTTKAIVQW